MEAVNDVFISYSHIDEEEEWVGQLDDLLRKRVQQRLGEAVKFWRDPALTRNEDFEKIIKLELLKSRLLVSIISSRYVKSDWCKRELLTFCDVARQRGELMVNDKARVFKVVKLPPEPDDPPFPPSVHDLFQKTLGYEFYEADPNTRRNREFNSMFGADWKTKFCLRVDDLADDINKLLRVLRGKSSTAKDNLTEKTVYLAETGPDLHPVRDEIRRELRERGFMVLPDQALSTSLPELTEQVANDLRRCGSSIHLIGSQSSFIPAGSEQPVDQLQHEWATARGASGRFLRLIWMPRGLKGPEGRRGEFVKSLRDDPRAECIEDTTEGLKVFMLAKLAELQPRTWTVYLAETTSDLQRERAVLKEHLLSRGFKVLPETELSRVAANLESQVREALEGCDGSVHLIGAKYGFIPEDAELSVVELQASLAEDWSRGKGRPRLVWFSGLPVADQRQVSFVTRLRQSAPLSKKTQLLEDSIDKAEAVLIETLSRKEEAHTDPKAVSTAPGMVYLIYDKTDEEEAYALAQSLNSKGFYIPLIDFELDEGARLEAQRQNLAECDAGLIYWGKSPVNWLNTAISTLRKGTLGRNEHPMRARAVFVAPPAVTSQKPPLTPPDIMLIRQEREFGLDLLNPFLNRLVPS
jgi:hypothetical protein